MDNPDWNSPELDELRTRYETLCHAMQSGVAFSMEFNPSETAPKHLRVGVNSAMVETSVIAQILVEAGIITPKQWMENLITGMEAEVERYRQRFAAQGLNVTLA